MKKILSIIIFGFIISLSLNINASVVGDVDGDGKVMASDYILVRKHLLKSLELTGDKLNRADVDGKNGVTATDYLVIRQIILNGEEPINTKTITAKFFVSDPKSSNEQTKEISCQTKENEGCNITIPNLSVNSGYQFQGWSTSNSSKIVNYMANNTLLIKNDISLYSVVPKVVTVTFNVSDNVSGKNIKAEKFSLNYTDKSGNTVIEQSGTSVKLTCLSYNNEGCKLNRLPMVYAKGYMPHGFSKTIGGGNMSVPNTTFKEDTTVYSRVGYYNSIEIGYANISFQKIYGNMMLEIENGISQTYINKITTMLDKVYKYYPEVFYPGGKIFVLRSNTYYKILKGAYNNIKKSAGYTIATTNYNNCFIKFDSDTNSFMETLIHEIGHSFDNTYGNYISDKQDLINLYNKYKNTKNRPFRNYSYTNTMEFVADIFSATMSDLIYQKTGEKIHTFFKSIPTDVSNYVIASLNEKKNNYKNIGLIK